MIDNLARQLVQLGHEVLLHTIAASTCPVPQDHLFEEPVLPMGQSIPEAAHVLAAYESLQHCDVIHDHTVLGSLVAGAAGLPLPPRVCTNHGAFTPLTRRIFRTVARTTGVIAISHDHARRAGDVPIAAVIHHGIDLDAYRAGPGRGGYLAFIGRMSADKGVHRAVRIARAAGLPLRIVTKMRDADERRYFEERVLPLMCPEDPLPQELGQADRICLLQHAEALVNPIDWPEPFGLVMIESLGSGTPVLTMPRGAAEEIVQHGRTGFLCADDAAVVAAVGRVSTLSRGDCRLAAEKHFSARRMAEDHVALYRRMLEDPGRPSAHTVDRRRVGHHDHAGGAHRVAGMAAPEPR